MNADIRRMFGKIAEALKSVDKFQKYKVSDIAAVQDFSLLLKAAIMGAKAVGCT